MKFCPRCHRPIVIPEFVKQVKSMGKITIKCGNCSKGQIVIPPSVKPEPELISQE